MMNVYKVSQQLVSSPLKDIPAAVFQQLVEGSWCPALHCSGDGVA